jgi:uronate dehydrogenase
VIGSANGRDPNRILITGAAGNMGSMLRPMLRRADRVLRLADIVEIDAVPGEEFVNVDVMEAEAIAKACQDVHAIVHLGGISLEASFDEVLAVNVVGTHNVLRGAVDAGVPRVIIASSNHAVGFYSRQDAHPEDGLPDEILPRPDTFYGWSKAATESLGALYHHRFGIDVTVLRIGSCFVEPPDTRALATWLAPTDAARLLEACLNHPHGHGFRVVWGVSDNTRRWWSLSGSTALGYKPTEDSERFAAERIARYGEPDVTDPVHDLVGGATCQAPLGVPPADGLIAPRPREIA